MINSMNTNKQYIIAPKKIIKRLIMNNTDDLYNFYVSNNNYGKIDKHIRDTYVHVTDDDLCANDMQYEKYMMLLINKISDMKPQTTILSNKLQKHPECCKLAIYRKN